MGALISTETSCIPSYFHIQTKESKKRFVPGTMTMELFFSESYEEKLSLLKPLKFPRDPLRASTAIKHFASTMEELKLVGAQARNHL